MTAAGGIRGLLAQEGLDLNRMKWVEGAVEGPGGHGKPSNLPPLKAVKTTRNTDTEGGLSQLLGNGDIAATIEADLPPSLDRAPNFQRLFPNFKEAKEDSYRTHGIFPIMHLAVVKRSVVESHLWIPSSLFNAFTDSKNLALRRMKGTGSLRYMLPWWLSELDDIEEVFPDGDPWPYGVEANQKTLEKLVEFLFEQGMIELKPTLEELVLPVRANQWNVESN